MMMGLGKGGPALLVGVMIMREMTNMVIVIFFLVGFCWIRRPDALCLMPTFLKTPLCILDSR